MAGVIIQITIFLISTAITIDQAKKMKAKMAAAAEARKGSMFTVHSEAISLPVVYGRQMMGGTQFDHKISSDYVYSAPENDTFVFLSDDIAKKNVGGTMTAVNLFNTLENISVKPINSGALSSNVTGTKNEFMFAKHAICHGGISAINHIKVNEKSFSHRDYKKGQRIIVYPDGGTSNLLQANGYPSSDKFTNVCYAAEVFRLDRDEGNYSGAPSVQFMIDGVKIRKITLSGSTYSINSTREYSNNPAFVLLDYLTNNVYGKGLLDSEVNLKSFYDAGIICESTVLSNASIAGHIFGSKPVSSYPTAGDFPDPNDWGYEDVVLQADDTLIYYLWAKTGGTDKKPTGSFNVVSVPTRNVPLYECNVTLDTEKGIRDNIETIMLSMNYAELTWDTEGKYKLLLDYPANDSETSALVTQSFNKDNILSDLFNIQFPSASDRFNQVTVSFLNEHEDFKTDSATFPTRGSGVHNTFLAEDNGQPFEAAVSPDHISDPYHALAKAEQMVRTSRSIFTIDFTTNREGLTLEPGDLINVTLPEVGLSTATVFRVQAVKVTGDFTTEVQASFFNPNVLAWNVADGIAYPKAEVFTHTVESVNNIVVSQTGLANYEVGKLTWDYADDENLGNFTYEIYFKVSADSDFISLGTTNTKSFSFGKLDGLDTANTFDFKVVVRTVLGSRSLATIISNQVLIKGPLEVSSINITEEVYVTNNASGVKSRALVEWSPDLSSVNNFYYKVEYKKTTDSVYIDVGTTSSNNITIPDVSNASYDFQVTPFSAYDFPGTAVVVTSNMVGLSAAPADPSGFAGNINEGQINLSWNLSSDLDVIYGGSCEIRFHNSVTASASWDTSAGLVDSLSGNTNNKTVPTLKGTFFIKFKDSHGTYSVNAATVVSNFVDDSFNQVEQTDEHTPGYLGTKTNCSVIGGNLELSSGQTEMTYIYNGYVDLGEVETVRVSPTIEAAVTTRGVDVEDYVLVSTQASFAGPVQQAALRVLVSTTQDNPAGSPTWSTYELLTVGSFTCRGLRFKFIGTAQDTNTSIVISQLGILLDKKDVVKTGSEVSSTSGDTTVTFTTPFYGGIGGTSNPTIGTNTIGGSTGDELFIISRNKNGFVYSIYNSGSRVQRTVDWQAIGQ